MTDQPDHDGRDLPDLPDLPGEAGAPTSQTAYGPSFGHETRAQPSWVPQRSGPGRGYANCYISSYHDIQRR